MSVELWVDPDPIHTAAALGDLAALKVLDIAIADLNRFDDLGWTPLHHAVDHEQLEAAAWLIRAGADVNAHDESKIGETPLGQVAQTCSLALARLLVDGGANPLIRGWMGISALDRTARRQRRDGPAVHALLVQAARRFRA